jgi:hypothetical protein
MGLIIDPSRCYERIAGNIMFHNLKDYVNRGVVPSDIHVNMEGRLAVVTIDPAEPPESSIMVYPMNPR